MVIAIAFSHVDAHLVHEQAAQIEALGGCRGHTLALMASARVQDHLFELKDKFLPLFDHTQCFVADFKERGFPQSANDLFRHCLYQIHKTGNKDPIFYAEPDVAPLKAGFADTLNTAFNLSGRRFLGVVQPTTFDLGNGRYAKRADEPHMVGAGVYPYDFAFRSKLLHFAQEEPWDTFMRWEITPEAAHTDLIQHNWSTRNYRRDEAGTIICDPQHPNGLANPVRPDAVVLHGCKDGSIYRALTVRPAPTTTPVADREERIIEAILRNFASQPPYTAEELRKPRKKRGVLMKKGRGTKGSKDHGKAKSAVSAS